jgi:hypothetical protein
MNGTPTPGGLRWTQDRVRDYRKQQRIRAASPDKKRDTLTMNQVQARLGISHNAALALVRLGLLAPDQVAPFAPWRVTHQQLASK